MTAERGNVVMTGIDDRPLLVLDRVEEGRVALLASDHAWLWTRGYEGGGPQLELLRRLAHWMMKEPELEEEALTATAEGQTMRITRRTLAKPCRRSPSPHPMAAPPNCPCHRGPGRFDAELPGPEIGLYRLENGDQSAVIGLGPAAPREFVETIASDEPCARSSTRCAAAWRGWRTGCPSAQRARRAAPPPGAAGSG